MRAPEICTASTGLWSAGTTRSCLLGLDISQTVRRKWLSPSAIKFWCSVLARDHGYTGLLSVLHTHLLIPPTSSSWSLCLEHTSPGPSWGWSFPSLSSTYSSSRFVNVCPVKLPFLGSGCVASPTLLIPPCLDSRINLQWRPGQLLIPLPIPPLSLSDGFRDGPGLFSESWCRNCGWELSGWFSPSLELLGPSRPRQGPACLETRSTRGGHRQEVDTVRETPGLRRTWC